MIWLWFFLKVGVVLGILMGGLPGMILMERWVCGWIQQRHGPNRVGPRGTLQPLADVIKFITKEEIMPAQADRVLFILGPFLVFLPPAVGMCVIPFGSELGRESLQVANVSIGVLFVMSVVSVGVYGIVLGGWSSANKYALLGSLRASAQLISYELTLGLTILLAIMMAGSLDMQVIVNNQVENGWGILGGGTLWALPCGILGFVLIFATSLAENNRLPFDMAECEAELVAGYHTEYSSMKFAMYFMGEYFAMILMASVITTLFLGGWHFPFITDPAVVGEIAAGLTSVGVFSAKIGVLLFTFVWIRWTLPRFRYDQIMQIGWKLFLPAALVNLAVLAVINVYVRGGA